VIWFLTGGAIVALVLAVAFAVAAIVANDRLGEP
jgi:hypothetical protein